MSGDDGKGILHYYMKNKDNTPTYRHDHSYKYQNINYPINDNYII